MTQHAEANEPSPQAPPPADASPATDAPEASLAADGVAPTTRSDTQSANPCDRPGWEHRVFREELEDSFAIRTQLTWVLSRGPEGKVCVSAGIRHGYGYLRYPRGDRRDADKPWPFVSVPVETEWFGDPTATIVFEGTETAGEMRLHATTAIAPPADAYLAPSLKLKCATTAVGVRPVGTAQFYRAYFFAAYGFPVSAHRVLDGERNYFAQLNAQMRSVFWTSTTVTSIKALLCQREWPAATPRLDPSHQSPPRRGLVFAPPSAGSPGVEWLLGEGNFQKLTGLRWARGTDAGAEPPTVDAGVLDADWEDASVRVFRESVTETTGFRRLTWHVRLGAEPRLVIAWQRPAVRTTDPIWQENQTYPREDDYAWAPPTEVRYRGRREGPTTFRFEASTPGSFPELGTTLELHCHPERVTVHPHDAKGVVVLVRVPFEPKGPMPAGAPPPERWRWAPESTDTAVATVCDRRWLDGPSDAAVVDASAPLVIPHPLSLVAPNRHASGVGWLDRGDGEGGALRWFDNP